MLPHVRNVLATCKCHTGVVMTFANSCHHILIYAYDLRKNWILEVIWWELTPWNYTKIPGMPAGRSFQLLEACCYRLPKTSFASRSCREISQFRNPVLWIRRHIASPPLNATLFTSSLLFSTLLDNSHLCPPCVHSSQHDSTRLTSCHLHTLWPCMSIYIYIFIYIHIYLCLYIHQHCCTKMALRCAPGSNAHCSHRLPSHLPITGPNTTVHASAATASSDLLQSHITATVPYGHHFSSVLHHIPSPTVASTFPSLRRVLLLDPNNMFCF